MKARVHVSFFRSASRRAPRVSPIFRKGGEGKVKACLHLFLHRNDLILNSFSGGVKGEGKKRKLTDMRVRACAREESWGGASETRLVFFDSPRVLRDTGRLLRKLYWRGIGDVEVWFYLSLQKTFCIIVWRLVIFLF